ncbi:hypothetical protein EXIGLDRAFT_778262 [Exidia glandulosa HHB12029]|uniref:Uncharacterized protein n=1 Tax=Exidia glandulosa HHB12029 TaxID=1314781 RepID=A0A165ZHC5_EXIGL|nr:hypothetical protein EXIGLDRAFT_778262 [Exidia glandulosa HHB12029]
MFDNLPVELVREVVEHAAAADRHDACALALVSRAVHAWTLPVLLSRVSLRTVAQAARFIALLHARADAESYFRHTRALRVACPLSLGWFRGAEHALEYTVEDATTGEKSLYLTIDSIETLARVFPTLQHFAAPRLLLDALAPFASFCPRALGVDSMTGAAFWAPTLRASVVRLHIDLAQGSHKPQTEYDFARFPALAHLEMTLPTTKVSLKAISSIIAAARKAKLASVTVHVPRKEHFEVVDKTVKALKDPRISVVRGNATVDAY